MKVGILEEKDNVFASHVRSGLSGIETEYVAISDLVSGRSDYKVVLDRSSYFNPYIREYMKSLALHGTYVINNPFAASSTNKMMDMQICNHLGIPYPKTVVLPLFNQYELDYMREPDLDRILEDLELPCVLKPHNGYAWDHVYIVTSIKEFKNMYQALKGSHILLAQEYVESHDYYRVFCVGKKEVLPVRYDPKPGGMGKYMYSVPDESDKALKDITKWTLEINKAIDFDFNAIEWCIDEDGKPYIIDAFNDTPEIIKGMIPESFYDWLVDRTCCLIREKFSSDETNRNIFPILTENYIRKEGNNISIDQT